MEEGRFKAYSSDSTVNPRASPRFFCLGGRDGLGAGLQSQIHGFEPHPGLQLIFENCYGENSSVGQEHYTVDVEAAGSIPVSHPIKIRKDRMEDLEKKTEEFGEKHGSSVLAQVAFSSIRKSTEEKKELHDALIEEMEEFEEE